MDDSTQLISLSFAMFLGSFVAGAIPLTISLSEVRRKTFLMAYISTSKGLQNFILNDIKSPSNILFHFLNQQCNDIIFK